MHDVDKAHIRAVEVSKEVDDTAWQKNATVELSDQGCFFGRIPVLDSSNMLDPVLATI